MPAPLAAFGPEIWLSDGPVLSSAAGFHYPTRMAVLRLRGGGLWVWSPIALTTPLRLSVAQLGPVQVLVAPNLLHHMAMGDWQAAFPQARLAAPAALAAKRPDLRIDDVLGAADLWPGEVEALSLPGNAILTETAFFHRESRTALLTDLLQNLPGDWFRGWRGLVARADLMLGDRPRVPRKFRLGAFGQRRALRQARDRLLDWPVDRVVMAHGTPVTENGQAFLRDAFSWL